MRGIIAALLLFLLILNCSYLSNAYIPSNRFYIKPSVHNKYSPSTQNIEYSSHNINRNRKNILSFPSLYLSSVSLGSTTNAQNNKSFINNIRSQLPAILALFALITQTSALTICMRVTRRASAGNASKLYIATTAVVMCETIKLLVSSYMFVRADCEDNINQALSVIKKEFTENWLDLIKITLPSALYVIQNNLQFIAVSNLPAEVFQVLIQAKIVTTAIFSVFLLQKSLTIVQWLSILGLAVGVGVVQLSFPAVKASSQAINYTVGFIAVLISCFTSGFAGVFFEKIMKAKPNILWLRNIELSLLSIIIALFAAFGNDFTRIQSQGFFYGYTPMVLLVVLLQAFGGITVSLVVKYTNSMTKGFATAGSIILSCLLSALLLCDCTLNRMFFVGTSVVCAATVGYSLPADTVPNLVRVMRSYLAGLFSRN